VPDECDLAAIRRPRRSGFIRRGIRELHQRLTVYLLYKYVAVAMKRHLVAIRGQVGWTLVTGVGGQRNQFRLHSGARTQDKSGKHGSDDQTDYRRRNAEAAPP